MKKRKYEEVEPKFNYIYEFYKGKERFELYEILPDGNYKFINLEFGNVTYMTRARFSYKWNTQDGKEIAYTDRMLERGTAERTIKETKKTPVQNVKKPTSTPTPAPMHASEDEILILTPQLEEIRQALIKKLSGLSKYEIEQFNKVSVKPVQDRLAVLKGKGHYKESFLYNIQATFDILKWSI